MKVTKKILSIVLVLLLAVSAVSGLAISASGATAPKSATLNIYKGAVDQVDSGTDKTKDQILDDGETYTDQVIGNIPGLTGTPSDEPTGFKPLQGAIFEIYYQGPLGTAVPTTPDTSEAALKKTVVTGESGLATFTASDDEYTTGDGPTGLYYVKEVFTGTGDGGRPLTASSSITTLSAPFFVYLPMTAQADASGNNGTISGDVQSAGERWLTSVSVYPKNLITLGGATLTKTINGKYFSAPADNADAQVLTSEELALLEENPGFILYRKAENAGENDTEISEEIFIENASTNRNKITDSTYSAAKIFMKGGKIAVDGLPAGTYVFKETTQAVYDGQTLPQAPDCEFTITAGHNYDVVTDVTDDNFGTITAVTAGDDPTQFAFTVDNASTPTVTKTVVDNVTEYTVTDPDDNTKTVSAKTFTEGDYFNYKVSVTSPTDINYYERYVITDTVDSTLDIYDRDYYITCGVDEDDDPVYFTRGTDFTWSVSGNVITITLTESGIQKITPGSPVEITFRCKINNTAVINTGIKNTATLAWTNKAGREGTSASNPVYVATLGYTMAKVDSEARTALEGAEFEIHTTTDAPIYFTLNNGVYTAQADYTDNTTVKSDANGMIKIEGLAGGTYKLVETKAPSGYQLLTQPVTITVNTTSNAAITNLTTASASADRIVANVKQPDLPITGGMGTLLFTVGGLLLSGGAVFAYVWFKKRRSNEEKA